MLEKEDAYDACGHVLHSYVGSLQVAMYNLVAGLQLYKALCTGVLSQRPD
jgi:hypothetical protein